MTYMNTQFQLQDVHALGSKVPIHRVTQTVTTFKEGDSRIHVNLTRGQEMTHYVFAVIVKFSIENECLRHYRLERTSVG